MCSDELGWVGAYRVYDVLALGMAYMHDMYQSRSVAEEGAAR